MDWLFLAAAGLAGLLAGSFLNVAIHRGPALWELVDEPRDARGGLWGPRSRCPACGKTLRIAALVPVVSYLVLRGRCAECGAAISPRYPAVEIIAVLAALAAAAAFGPGLDAAFAAVFLWALIALAAVDFETGYLPDAITLPLLLLGLLANLDGRFAALPAAAIGAAAGYGSFALVGWAYQAIRRREGLGQGDAKLLAAIGAWGGWQSLAPSVLAGALSTLIVLALLAMARRRPLDSAAAVPFGTSLCLGGAADFLAAAFLPGWGLFA